MVGNDLANVLTSSPSAQSSGKSWGPLARAALKSFSLGPRNGREMVKGMKKIEGIMFLARMLEGDQGVMKTGCHLSSLQWFA